MKDNKTNVMRLLDVHKIPYECHTYPPDPSLTGGDIAAMLKENPDHVYKTLVTEGHSGAHYVFIIPVQYELNLKKAARACNEKSVCMIRQKDLLSLSGYVHGGCSPIGMKKAFPSFIHHSASALEKMFVSAGRVGYQIGIHPRDLIQETESSLADLV